MFCKSHYECNEIRDIYQLIIQSPSDEEDECDREDDELRECERLLLLLSRLLFSFLSLLGRSDEELLPYLR